MKNKNFEILHKKGLVLWAVHDISNDQTIIFQFTAGTFYSIFPCQNVELIIRPLLTLFQDTKDLTY